MSWQSQHGLLIYFTWDWADWTIGFLWNEDYDRLWIGGPWWGLNFVIMSPNNKQQRHIGFKGESNA